MPNETPPKLPTRWAGPGAGPLLCPGCNGNQFSERSSFKTASEPVLGAPSIGVEIDLMNCARCGVEFPAVRGRRLYALVAPDKLQSLLADLEQAKRTNAEMERLLATMTRRSQGIEAQIADAKDAGTISVLQAKVARMESETRGLEERRDRLAQALESVAATIRVRGS